MEGSVIKSFLVGLGFQIDDSSLAKFNKSIVSATARVGTLYTAINAAAAGIAYSITKISSGFEQMGYEYHIIAPALNKELYLRNQLLKAYAAAGINITKVIKESIALNLSIEKTKFAFEAIYKSVASRFFGLLTKQSDMFRKNIYANMPKILNVLEHFVKFIFKAFEAVTELGARLWSILSRVYDFFVSLDRATDGWSTIILGVIAAWKLLNLEFLATPLGMLLAGLTAILALYDDFKVWQEGGKSFFDWSAALPVIKAVSAELSKLADVWRSIVDVVGNFVLAIYQLFHSDYKGFFESFKAGLQSLLDVFINFFGFLKSQLGLIGSVGSFLGGLFGSKNVAANLQNNPTASLTTSPLGSTGIPQSLTNQNVQQQTQINVMGVADANAVGKAVAGEQGRVNFDMTRNLKGSTR